MVVASAGPYATICTSLQTDNHTNTSSLNFYRPDALSDAQPTVSKHWRQQESVNLSSQILGSLSFFDKCLFQLLNAFSQFSGALVSTSKFVASGRVRLHLRWCSLGQSGFQHCSMLLQSCMTLLQRCTQDASITATDLILLLQYTRLTASFPGQPG